MFAISQHNPVKTEKWPWWLSVIGRQQIKAIQIPMMRQKSATRSQKIMALAAPHPMLAE